MGAHAPTKTMDFGAHVPQGGQELSAARTSTSVKALHVRMGAHALTWKTGSSAHVLQAGLEPVAKRT